MDRQLKELLSKELEQFYCSILLDEVRENVRKLKAYGIEDAEIEEVLHDEALFPQLIINEDYKIVVAGKLEAEVMMEPLVKAVYLLILKHPEGIVQKRLPEYREELKDIYLLVKSSELTKRVAKSIEDVTNPLQNSFNEKCARIRKAFAQALPRNIVRYYAISGNRGEAKRIALPRANVTWECDMTRSQGL